MHRKNILRIVSVENYALIIISFPFLIGLDYGFVQEFSQGVRGRMRGFGGGHADVYLLNN